MATPEFIAARIPIGAVHRPIATVLFSIGPGNTETGAVRGADPLSSTQKEILDGR
jgi:hypothetical protein